MSADELVTLGWILCGLGAIILIISQPILSAWRKKIIS